METTDQCDGTKDDHLTKDGVTLYIEERGRR